MSQPPSSQAPDGSTAAASKVAANADDLAVKSAPPAADALPPEPVADAGGAPTGATPPFAPGASASSHLARGLALAAALAACVAAPGLIQQIEQGTPQARTVFALALGAALLALLTRLPRARTLRSLATTVYGALVLGGGAMVLLVYGSISASELDATVLVLAVATLSSWLGAVALNRWEARRAFATARRLGSARALGWGLTMVLCLPLPAWQLGLGLHAAWRQTLQGTPAEGLAGGAAAVVALAALVMAGAAAAWLPRLLARLQLRGAVSASAAGEALWFGALIVWMLALLATLGALLPWAAKLDVAQVLHPMWVTLGLRATSTLGDAASVAELPLRLLSIIAAHAATRLLLGRPGVAPPSPLLVLLPSSESGPATSRFLARLPGLWTAGPVTCVALPERALHDGGAHLQAAQLAGTAEWLFVRHPAGADAYLQAVPPPSLWRALPVREAYLGHDDWHLALRRWVTPHTWVLWVGEADPAVVMPRFIGEQVQPWLPPGRSVTVTSSRSRGWPDYFGASSDAAGSRRGLGSLPAWQGDDAARFVAWLRQRARAAPPRRILVLHDTAQLLLANRLTQRLAGRHDAEGRFVDAAPMGGGDLFRALGLPLWVAAVVVQAARHAPRQRQRQLGALLLLERSMRLFGSRDAEAPDAAASAYDVVLLRAAADGDRASEPLLPELLAGAQRRVAVVLDRGADVPPGCEGRVEAKALGSGSDGIALERLVSQLLAGEWLPVGAQAPDEDADAAADQASSAAPAASAVPAPEVSSEVPALDLLLLGLGLSVLRLQALRGLLKDRLPSSVRWSLLPGDDADAAAWVGGSSAHAVVLVAAAQQPVPQPALDAVFKAALAAGRPVWRAPMAVDASVAWPTALDRLPADWSPDDPVPGANLRPWADALAADLGQRLAADTPVRSPDALCLLATSEPDVLVVGRRDGWLRWGAQWRREHAADVRVLLALADGRVASADESSLILWQGRSLLARFTLPRQPRALAELHDEEGGHRIVAATSGKVLLVVSPDESDPSLAVREIELPAAVESIAALPVDGRGGWVATAGPAGLQLVHAGSGATRVPLSGRSGQPARVVATHGSRLFYGGVDEEGRGVIGLYSGELETSRPIVLSGWAARITALYPLDAADVLFGDAAGGVWRWMPERGANQARPVAKVSAAVQAIACSRQGTVTVLAAGRLFGCGRLGGETTGAAEEA